MNVYRLGAKAPLANKAGDEGGRAHGKMGGAWAMTSEKGEERSIRVLVSV